MKTIHWKLLLIGIVAVWAIYNAWPRQAGNLVNLKLGLDLKGGSYLVMQVEGNDAVKGECEISAGRLGDRLKKQGFPEVRSVVGDAVGEIVVSGIPAARLAEAEKLIETETGTWSVSSGEGVIRVQMPTTDQDILRDRAVRQALNTIQNRIDAFGVAETSVTRLGGKRNDRILVQLPGVEDPSRVKKLIQTQARLELRLAYYTPDGNGPYRGLNREDVLAQLGGREPQGVEILPIEEKINQDPNSALADGSVMPKEEGPRRIAEWIAVEKTSVVTGSDLQDARPTSDQWGQTVVSFTLRVNAADRFSRFTRDNINRIMPIVLDNKIKSAPVIRAEIGTHGQIEGNFTPIEADDLSLVLKAGALPARVNTIEERTVGPSLGKDSIDAGVRASLIGALLVAVFMLIYYRLSGVNALVALGLNLLILVAAMGAFGATLTLPGIAGYALTVGMAVDANVLIFERIREEQRLGKTVRGAIDAGFDKAFSAIFDSNLTTIISALFLFQYGTGPVKGFSVSLIIGLLANMFTAVFVSRVIYDLVIGDRVVRRLSI